MGFNSPSIKTDLPTFGLYALASAATIAVGSVGLAIQGAALDAWSRNPAAWIAGALLCGAMISIGRSRSVSIGAIVLTIVGLTVSLLVADPSGVHRWVDVGPLHINIAALSLPIALVALATLSLAPAILLSVIAGIGAFLVAQPDASQASAFLLAAASLLVRRRMPPAIMIGGLMGMAALALAAWLRPDPLQPVPEVEGVHALLAGISPLFAAVAALALAAASLVPLRSAYHQDEGRRGAAVALSIYFTATAVAPLLGAYPVPLLGVGMSFPVGWWLGVGLMCARGPSLHR